MALTRAGFCGSSAAYSTFAAKAEGDAGVIAVYGGWQAGVLTMATAGALLLAVLL